MNISGGDGGGGGDGDIYNTYDMVTFWLTPDDFTIRREGNIENIEMVTFWLTPDDFTIRREGDIESKGDWQTLRFKPFGHHAMRKNSRMGKKPN
jgi:hypothetical protein